MISKYLKGDTMLDNIKNFVKNIAGKFSKKTWLVIGAGVLVVVLWVVFAGHGAEVKASVPPTIAK